MSLIEGVGDEVTQLFIALTVIAVGIAAWCSTSISDQQPLRLLFLSEPQGQHQLTIQSNSSSSSASSSQRETADSSDTGQSNSNVSQEDVSVRAAVTLVSEDQDEIAPEDETNIETTPLAASSPVMGQVATKNISSSHSSDSSENPEAESENGDQHDVPTDVSILRQRRLAFLQKQGNTLLECTSHGDEVVTNEQDVKTESNTGTLMSDGMRIRLKYLNDNLKLVQGSPQETLGDFKRRHFAVELEGNKVVRLVFNGQILQSDNETLQGYGLFDNCVVHCLVHSRHTSSSGAESSSNINAARDPSNAGPNGAYREWDLSHMLYITLGLVLGVAWYFHYHLAHLFNVASTLGLLGLSTAFAISAAANYLPDTEEIRLI